MIVEAFEHEMTPTISLGALAKQSHIYLLGRMSPYVTWIPNIQITGRKSAQCQMFRPPHGYIQVAHQRHTMSSILPTRNQTSLCQQKHDACDNR